MATNIEGTSEEPLSAKGPATEGPHGPTEITTGDEDSEKYFGLSDDEMLEMFRLMYLSRRLDDAEINLKRQQKIYFQISGAGHEAALVGAGMNLEPGYDWFYPYYRDRALCLTVGMTPQEVLAEAVGAADDPNSGGRQMPAHWGHKDLNIVSQSSCTGTQMLQATGAAEVGRIMSAVEELKDRDGWEEDEVVYVSIGDGASSEGEFWEAVGTAATFKLPVLFMVEDNGYAISVPNTEQVHGGSISRATSGFENLFITEYDGCDPVESYGKAKEAVEYIREGNGPALCHAHVIRPYNHSMSDDERAYKPDAERDAEAERDPVTKFPEFLVDEGICDEDTIEEIRDSVDKEVRQAVDAALEMPTPHPDTALDYIYSPDVDVTSEAEFGSEPQWDEDAGEKTMVDLLNKTLRTEMARSPEIVVFGEDVADVTKEEYLGKVKGKGGVFKVTHRLQEEFGYRRVFNSPLAEANIVGRGIGMATRGLKPVVEIQFFDYIWPAFMQLRNELSNIRWRSNNNFKAPMVVRVPIGGYLKGGAPYHSQSGTTLFTHTPGVHVVMPSTAADAAGLLRTAIRCDDPVMFLEHKHLYRQTYNKSLDPGADYTIPFGKARTVQEGEDLSIITYGATVERSVRAAKQLRDQGISVEIIDLRTLNPYDWDAIAHSVKKTNKVLLVYEDNKSWGFGAEIGTRIADELFEYLDGPVRRVAALDSFVAYHPDLEDRILPQIDDIKEGIEWLYNY
jgi:2-oxoisovalerate dehydrogenase E1 component